MHHEPKSIADQIECLARLTGAPDSFVDQVRELFARKGISLQDDAGPYVQALEEAFIREECIRAGTQPSPAVAARPSSEASRIGKAYVRQIERLRRLHAGLRQRRAPSKRGSPAASDPSGLRPGFSGTGVVIRQQREELPMVPGPEELQ